MGKCFPIILPHLSIHNSQFPFPFPLVKFVIIFLICKSKKYFLSISEIRYKFVNWWWISFSLIYFLSWNSFSNSCNKKVKYCLLSISAIRYKLVNSWLIFLFPLSGYFPSLSCWACAELDSVLTQHLY